MAQINPFQHIKIEHLAPSPTNPRKYFDEESLREMADTIDDHGVIEPIIVRCWPDEYEAPNPVQGRPLYEIIAGERRYRASLLAGCDTVPALVRHLTTRQVLEIQIIENLQRRGVNELEEAEGYQLMMQDYGYTADELAAKVGKSRAYIYGRLKLCALCEEARQAYREGKLDASRALLIARIPGATLQAQALKDITESWQGMMTYRTAAQHIQNRYMRGLRNAIFALDDATLHPEAGPCTTCAKRPCNTPELYPDVPEDRAADVCTDTKCMKAKADAYTQRQADQAAAAGRQVVRAVSWSEFANDFVQLTAEDPDLPETIPQDEDGNDLPNTPIDDALYSRAPTVAEMLQGTGAQVEIVLVEHPTTRELIECVRHDEYRQAVPAPTYDAPPTRTTTPRPSEEAIKAEAARRRELFAAIRARYDHDAATWASPVTPELRIIAQQFWARSWPGTRDMVAQLTGITPDHMGSIADWLNQAPAHALLPLLLDLALAPAVDVPRYADDIATPAPLLDMAHALGIDPNSPSAPPVAAPETASTPTEAPPGGEDNAGEDSAGEDSAGDEPRSGLDVAAEIQVKRKAGSVPYRHPEHTDQTWSGRGRKPLWVEQWLAKGGTLEELSTPTQAAPAADTTAETPTPKTKGKGKGKVKAATAAKKPKEKAKTSGRAAAGGKKAPPDEPGQYRCPNTPDMLDGVAA